MLVDVLCYPWEQYYERITYTFTKSTCFKKIERNTDEYSGDQNIVETETTRLGNMLSNIEIVVKYNS